MYLQFRICDLKENESVLSGQHIWAYNNTYKAKDGKQHKTFVFFTMVEERLSSFCSIFRMFYTAVLSHDLYFNVFCGISCCHCHRVQMFVSV